MKQGAPALAGAEDEIRRLVVRPPRGSAAAARRRAAELLEQVGLSAVADHPAMSMSGGQQQRVAIARALAMNPDIVLADEPTGNLDTRSANDAFELFRDVNRRNGTSFLVVTHNLDLARRCDRIVEIFDGRIESDEVLTAAQRR